LIELLVVLAIMATLMSIVAPRYFRSVDKAKEAVLKTDLRLLRESIDKFRADHGHYPESLQQLAKARYIRDVPMDPMTDRSDSWVAIPPPPPAASGVYDVRSGASGVGSNHLPFSAW
jgi:general secretion pathway protein G